MTSIMPNVSGATRQRPPRPAAQPSLHFGKNYELPRHIAPPPSPNNPVDLFDGIQLTNRQERENLIASILEDVETAPALHARLTTLRADHPGILQYSELYPRQYIHALSAIAFTYEQRGQVAAQAHTTRFIHQAIAGASLGIS